MIIDEFPYSGVITRKISTTADNGDVDESVVEIYNGKMDVSLLTNEVGTVAQTANYVVFIPLIKGSDNKYNIPRKNDSILVNGYGEVFTLIVNDPIPSQLGGITVYATRGDW